MQPKEKIFLCQAISSGASPLSPSLPLSQGRPPLLHHHLGSGLGHFPLVKPFAQVRGLGFEPWAVLLGTAMGTQVSASAGGFQGPSSHLHPLAQLPEAPILPVWGPHSDATLPTPFCSLFPSTGKFHSLHRL